MRCWQAFSACGRRACWTGGGQAPAAPRQQQTAVQRPLHRAALGRQPGGGVARPLIALRPAAKRHPAGRCAMQPTLCAVARGKAPCVVIVWAGRVTTQATTHPVRGGARVDSPPWHDRCLGLAGPVAAPPRPLSGGVPPAAVANQTTATRPVARVCGALNAFAVWLLLLRARPLGCGGDSAGAS